MPVTHCESVGDCTLQTFASSTQQPDAVQSQSSPLQHAHTVSVVAVHAVWTPAAPHTEAARQELHGAIPNADHVVPATHGVSHTVSVVAVQAVLTPAVHVASAAQAVQGALPEAEKSVPAVHGTWHTVFDVGVQAAKTPGAPHEASVEHAAQGALPLSEKDVPASHGTT